MCACVSVNVCKCGVCAREHVTTCTHVHVYRHVYAGMVVCVMCVDVCGHISACAHMSRCWVEGPVMGESPWRTYKVDVSGGRVLLIRGLAGGL